MKNKKERLGDEDALVKKFMEEFKIHPMAKTGVYAIFENSDWNYEKAKEIYNQIKSKTKS